MHVKMISIESGVMVPKVLFTLYVNVKIVTAKIFGHFDEKALGLLNIFSCFFNFITVFISGLLV
jgi:hypothetical protein